MKRILCYGDSNTWGYVPGTNGDRYSADIRWTTRLQALLGDSYNIIDAGLNGRTTNLDSPGEHFKNGLAFVDAELSMHRPLDMVIIMLGTNDLKSMFHRNEHDIAGGLKMIIDEIQSYHQRKTGKQVEILLVSPAPLLDCVTDGSFNNEFNDTSVSVSRGLADVLCHLAEEMGIDYLDAKGYAEVSSVDGIHLTGKGHMSLAQALYDHLSSLETTSVVY